MRVTVGHIPCHAPTVTRKQLRNALRRHGVGSLGFSEAYRREIFWWLTHRLRWKAIAGKSLTDRRRGPKDNPLLVRRHHRLIDFGALKGCDAVHDRDGRISKLAPERWIGWAVYRIDGHTVAHINLHPNAGVQHIRHDAERRVKYRQHMQALDTLIARLRARHPDAHIIVTGDLNWTDSGGDTYAPRTLFNRLGMVTFNRHFDWIAWTPCLELVGRVDVILPQHNGQDHPWLYATFKPKETP